MGPNFFPSAYYYTVCCLLALACRGERLKFPSSAKMWSRVSPLLGASLWCIFTMACSWLTLSWWLVGLTSLYCILHCIALHCIAWLSYFCSNAMGPTFLLELYFFTSNLDDRGPVGMQASNLVIYLCCERPKL
jgi:hypothetical protein